MPYAKIEKSGCCERHGNVQLRFSFYLEPDDARYDERYVLVVDITSAKYLEGYQGEVDEMGSAIDSEACQIWRDSLPKVWHNNTFHNHFVYADPDITDAEIKVLMNFHLANFYEAWKQGKPIRSGWAIETKIQPLHYDEVDKPKIYSLRKQQCLDRITTLSAISTKEMG